MIEKIKIANKTGKIVIGRRITVTSYFSSDIENVWSKIMEFDTLRFICRPKATFISCESKSFEWKKGNTYRFRLYVYGFIPMGIHTIHVENINPDTRELLTGEFNKIVTVWNHYIKMTPVDDNKIQYTDKVDLYAGTFSPVFAWWTERFYKHRQRRWILLLNK